MIGLADCNNFYCSCERVFRPDLIGKPVVVLSNNDGCIIARSEEAKALGYKMGDPFYQVKEKLEAEGVAIFSSNYTLYGSLSNRVMSMLSHYSPHIDQYSIDESFFEVDSSMAESFFREYLKKTSTSPDYESSDHESLLHRYGARISADVLRAVGIPISIGIAETKTLAKIGSKFAKKYKGYQGCCLIDTDERRRKALSLFPVEDVWGIGRQIARKLDYMGIRTAAQFADKKESWVRSHFNITTVRTWKELNGESCISIEELPQKKSICTSRSFADEGITDKNVIEEAVANFAVRCAEKLRHQGSVCRESRCLPGLQDSTKTCRNTPSTIPLPCPSPPMLRMKSWAPHSLSSEPDIPNQWLTADPTAQECHSISRKQELSCGKSPPTILASRTSSTLSTEANKKH